MTDLAGLRRTVAVMAGPDIAVAVQDTQSPEGTLWSREVAAISRAIPARRAEFTAGRVAARQAMTALGLPASAIPMGPDRAPQWPAGLIGSIAHAGRACVVALARSEAFAGIGIDLEPAEPLCADLWETVLRPEERAALALLPEDQQGLAALRIFVAKEAVYKCQYPQSRTLLGFGAFTVTVSATGFTARFAYDTPPFGAADSFHGQFGLHNGLIIALVVQHRVQTL